mgnify:CR=1 FL=1
MVSIHAPAWGATAAIIKLWGGKDVSIHAPAWGATPALTRPSIAGAGFNPRARVGRDTGKLGVTAKATGFNPRARVGRDVRATQP